MIRLDDGLLAALLERGVSRRSFLKFSAAMASALALPATFAPRIAAAVAAAPRLPVIWLRGQDCAGNTEAFLRATTPTVSELVLDLLSIDYHETLMAPSGDAATLARTTAMEKYPDGYLAIVEGGIPTADGGAHCTIGGRPFRDIVREVSDGALATIAVGSCAFDGGTPAARGGPTGAAGVGSVIADGRLIALPGCPLNVENLTATIVHYLTFKELPPTDGRGRPLFAYGGLIHNQCERRAHFEFGEFALTWGDEGAQKGWCLYKLGCKGPEAFANCPTVRYGGGTSWTVKAGHGCVGCTMPGFWDAMTPAYKRLPPPVPFLPTVSVDTVGQVLVGGVAALTMVHGGATIVRSSAGRAGERRRAGEAAAGEVAVTAEPAEGSAGNAEAAGREDAAGAADAADAGGPAGPGVA
jgi:hydrogenase small subunit